jgi:HPt (histidine-containing phosphotransfer) domain-containing protein
VRALSEADARLDLEDLTAKAKEWADEAMDLLARLQDPVGVSTYQDYADAEG